MSLRLTQDDHQPEPRDVEAHRDHICSDRTVHALLDLMEPALETAPRLGHLVSRHARGQLHHLGEGLAVAEESGLLADPLARSVGLNRVLDLLLEDPPSPA